jgi:drug/metabolite transporter (DMT)-like permease
MSSHLPELSAVVFGLVSALSWGAGDFTGGLASKRSNVYSVVIISQVAGALLLLAMAILFREPFPELKDLMLGAAAGVGGAIGLVAFYRGLALGRMGVVAPVAAVVTAALPVTFGILLEGLPDGGALPGFALAFLAVWLVSSTGKEEHIRLSDMGPSLTAGVFFGLFFILIDQVSTGAVFWPLVAARAASLSFLLVIACLRGQSAPPQAGQLPIIVLAGLLDAGGNVFYALAAQAGRLDIAAMLAALYPAATVLLARLVLKERLAPQQWAGLVAALIAVIMITS